LELKQVICLIGDKIVVREVDQQRPKIIGPAFKDWRRTESLEFKVDYIQVCILQAYNIIDLCMSDKGYYSSLLETFLCQNCGLSSRVEMVALRVACMVVG
jgi:hypothetical protein